MGNVLFLLQKFVGDLLMPLPVVLLLLLLALLLLLRRKTRWLGVIVVLLATGLLFSASYAPVSTQLTASLERQYPSYRPGSTPAEYIAVLGSGHISGARLPVTSELNPEGVVRLAEGLRVYRLNPGSKLIFTGFGGSNPESYAEKSRELALDLGVPQEDILAFGEPKDTAEEAQLIARRFAGTRLVLVTSAVHMPRAMALFRRAGLDPVPAPTNHLARPVRSYWVFPAAATLDHTRAWLHEQLGLTWAKLMGQIMP